jgi:hypothetical protein
MRELIPSAPGIRGRERAERLVRLAESQSGVISRAQLLTLGFSDSAISRWAAANRIHRLYPTVYALGHRVIGDEGRLRAALMYVGAPAVLSHSTAASWWGLLEGRPGPIHVTTDNGVGPKNGLVVHRPRRIEATSHRGLPVTPVPRTLLDIAPMVSFARLRRALAEVEYQRLADLDEVAAVLGRGRPGSKALKRALAMHRPELARTLSVLEERFLALCERYGIPLPEVNVTVSGLMVDALWRDQRVVVELDGRAAHSTSAAIERDRSRDLTLRAAGLAVHRYTWEQVTRQAELVASDLRTALGLHLLRTTPGNRG